VVERTYLSIGDVLSLLREEFPDITISKIRFLESRGLLIPERTPSGYRKFYEHDVDRLRWILRQQRENFLPLKVIKGRLEGNEPSSEPTPMFEVVGEGDAPPPLEAVYVGSSNGSYGGAEPDERVPAEVGVGAARRATVAAARPRVSAGTGAITPRRAPEARADERHSASSGPEPSDPSDRSDPSDLHAGDIDTTHSSVDAMPTASGSGDATAPPAAGAPATSAAPPRLAAPIDMQVAAIDVQAANASSPDNAGSGRRADSTAARVPPTSGRGFLPAGGAPVDSGSLAGASLTAAELAQASGLDAAQVEELESYGLIESRMVAGVPCYDENALVVCGLASGFARFGVEARHLRLFKHAAERQASLYSQIVMPLLRQRNPDARRRAHDDLTRLSDLGASMQACFAKAVLRDLTRR
jgi:DNA-binding transcriptional MerR regulator